jgi:hypothetical protein
LIRADGYGHIQILGIKHLPLSRRAAHVGVEMIPSIRRGCEPDHAPSRFFKFLVTLGLSGGNNMP